MTLKSEILGVRSLSKSYPSGEGGKLTVLDNINFSVSEGDSFAIVGPSGSGKTTLLGLCAGLDRSDEGSISLCGTELSSLSEDGRARLRNRFVGFVFQNFQLMPSLTALENVMLPCELGGDKKAKNRASELLARVGLGDRLHHYPLKLSGGEQQRTALARAFAANPKIVFADEPTGNLDGDTGEKVEELLFEMNRELGTTLILVTHDLELAKKTGRMIRLKSGKLIYDSAVSS